MGTRQYGMEVLCLVESEDGRKKKRK